MQKDGTEGGSDLSERHEDKVIPKLSGKNIFSTEVLIPLVISSTSFRDYLAIVLVCRSFYHHTQTKKYWQILLTEYYPEYTSQTKFDLYVKENIDYKKISYILLSFTQHRLAPEKISFESIDNLLIQFSKQTDQKIAKPSPWVSYINGHAAELKKAKPRALQLYKEIIARSADDSCVAAAAIELSRGYWETRKSYSRNDTVYILLENIFNKTPAARIAFYIAKNFEETGKRKTAIRWHLQALKHYTKLEIKEVNDVITSLLKLTPGHPLQEEFDLLQAYCQFPTIIQEWPKFVENKIVDVADQQQIYDQWKTQLAKTRNPIAVYNFVMLYCEYFGKPIEQLRYFIQFEFSREQIISHAEECIAMLSNLFLQSQLRKDIQMFVLRIDQRQIYLLEGRYKTCPDVEIALILGVLHEQRYLSPLIPTNMKEANYYATAYWYQKAINLNESTSELAEIKSEVIENAKRFLSENPIASKQANKLIQDEDDENVRTAFNRHRLTTRISIPSRPPSSSPSPPRL